MVNVNAVAVKLPEFWPADPGTWFHAVWFHELPTDIVILVRDLVNSMQPNTPDAYEQLKARLTTSYGKAK
jgi:hypothetical protein